MGVNLNKEPLNIQLDTSTLIPAYKRKKPEAMKKVDMMNATTSSNFIPKRMREFIDKREYKVNEGAKVMGEAEISLTGGVSMRKQGKDSALIKGGDFRKRTAQRT